MVPWILMPENLSMLFERYKDVKAPKILEFFEEKDAEDVSGLVQWDIEAYYRTLAPIVPRGGSPTPIAPPARGSFVTAAIGTSMELDLTAMTLKNLRAPGKKDFMRGEDGVRRAMDQMIVSTNKLKAMLAYQCLGVANGYLSFTLPGLSAATTVDLHYRASHVGSNSSCPLYTATWATHTTDIRSQIMDTIVMIEQDAGKEATHLLCNTNTAQYLYKNDQVITTFTPAQNQELLATGHISELYGLKIIEHNEVYVDGSGVVQKFVPDGFVAIFAGSDNSNRAFIACAPNSPKASPDHRGMFWHSYEDPSIDKDVVVQCEYAFLPVETMPDEVVFNTDIDEAGGT